MNEANKRRFTGGALCSGGSVSFVSMSRDILNDGGNNDAEMSNVSTGPDRDIVVGIGNFIV